MTRREFIDSMLMTLVVPFGALTRRDDTAFIQRCLDTGRAIPVGAYRLRSTVVFTNRHVDGVGSTYEADFDVAPAFDATGPWTGRFNDNTLRNCSVAWRGHPFDPRQEPT